MKGNFSVKLNLLVSQLSTFHIPDPITKALKPEIKKPCVHWNITKTKIDFKKMSLDVKGNFSVKPLLFRYHSKISVDIQDPNTKTRKSDNNRTHAFKNMVLNVRGNFSVQTLLLRYHSKVTFHIYDLTTNSADLRKKFNVRG